MTSHKILHGEPSAGRCRDCCLGKGFPCVACETALPPAPWRQAGRQSSFFLVLWGSVLALPALPSLTSASSLQPDREAPLSRSPAFALPLDSTLDWLGGTMRLPSSFSVPPTSLPFTSHLTPALLHSSSWAAKDLSRAFFLIAPWLRTRVPSCSPLDM